jgi:hypothetical protein
VRLPHSSDAASGRHPSPSHPSAPTPLPGENGAPAHGGPSPPDHPADPGRRTLLASALPTAGALAAGALVAGPARAALGWTTGAQPGAQPGRAQPSAEREIYELRVYRLRNGPQVARMQNYCRAALVPALRRQGTGPVGVFTVAAGPDGPSLYLLIPHASAESVVLLPERLAGDPEYRRAGAPVLEAPASDPPYEGIESSLLRAFVGMPRLEVPAQAAGGKKRLFELRRYESHSERASQTKVDVFDRDEITIFRRHGMAPVFFGQSLIGERQPNLTYMLAFDDMRDRDARWSAFVSDPDFRAIISKPEYSDAAIVSSISNLFLSPTPFSQL